MEEKNKKKFYEEKEFKIVMMIAVIIWIIIIFTYIMNPDIITSTESDSNNTINSNVVKIEQEETEEEKQVRLEREKIEKEQKEAEEKQKILKEETQFKAECKTYYYQELARNPEKIKGEKVKLTGEVVQSLQGNLSVDLRINITKTGKYSTYYTDTIYGIYEPQNGEDKILEKDIITIWGIAQGDYTYTSTLGTLITLPLIDIKYVEITK